MVVLYKVVFEREEVVVVEKMMERFVLPLVEENRKGRLGVAQYRNISIFVFSNQLKGLILN